MEFLRRMREGLEQQGSTPDEMSVDAIHAANKGCARWGIGCVSAAILGTVAIATVIMSPAGEAVREFFQKFDSAGPHTRTTNDTGLGAPVWQPTNPLNP